MDGYRRGTGGGRWARLFPGTPAVRTLSPVIVLVVAALGGAYALGRTLAPSDPHRASRQAAAVSTPSPTPAPAPDPAPDQSPLPLPLESDGPWGSRMTTGSSDVALTFDDGPDPRWTPLVLERLRQYHVKATFCLIGSSALRYPDLVRAIVADGHTLCNHSWNHDVRLGSRSRQTIQADLLRTDQAIRAAAPDARVAYFRQPGGNWTYLVVSVARQLGMTPLHWSVDPRDWTRPGAAKITATVGRGTAPGAIVLMHDGGGDRQGTVEALGSLLPDLTRRFQLAALPARRT